MAVVVSTHLFWIASRGAGITAMVLSSASVALGLMMGGKLRRGGGPDRRAYHEILSLSVMVAIAVHGLSLIGDSFLHPSLFDVTVPLVFSYERFATTLGIVAGWGMICLGLSYYVRNRIGNARWKVIHRLTALVWIGGLVHTFMEGTDAGQAWFIALIGITAAPAVLLLGARLVGYKPTATNPPPAGAVTTPTAAGAQS